MKWKNTQFDCENEREFTERWNGKVFDVWVEWRPILKFLLNLSIIIIMMFVRVCFVLNSLFVALNWKLERAQQFRKLENMIWSILIALCLLFDTLLRFLAHYKIHILYIWTSHVALSSAQALLFTIKCVCVARVLCIFSLSLYFGCLCVNCVRYFFFLLLLNSVMSIVKSCENERKDRPFWMR